jgi:GrpB-like predicted nucleotidyltransferase (UPF0157 family)
MSDRACEPLQEALARLGTPGNAIEVVPYDPAWPALFKQEASQILAACAPWLVAIEHIGSTAVPHLSAKPILDLMPGLARVEDGSHLVEPMKRLGYEYFGEHGISGRHYFVLRRGSCEILHVHMFQVGSREWQRHLLFRDHLRSHPEVARRYADLKCDLVPRHRNERAAYTDGKAEFVQSVLAAAGWSA